MKACAAALPLLAMIAGPARAADVIITVDNPVVEITVAETFKAQPDLATVGAGVTTRAPTAVEAMQLNPAAMDRVISRVKELGIPPDGIQTTGINLGAQYDYVEQTRSQRFVGYTASNRVSVILRQIPRTGEVLDALVAAGATDISGPDFSIDDDSTAKGIARRNAVKNAETQALEYARMASYNGVRLLEISETVSGNRPMVMAEDAIMATASRAKTPVEPGLVASGVVVTVKYEMTR